MANILRDRKTLKTWLTKTEYHKLKTTANKDIDVIANELKNKLFNQAVYQIYLYFEQHLPGFFNHFYNMTAGCIVIDKTKQPINLDMYRRCIKAAEFWIPQINDKHNLSYETLFNAKDPQYLLLQKQFFGVETWLGRKEEPLYWWFDLKLIQRLIKFLTFISKTKSYTQAMNKMADFFHNFNMLRFHYPNEKEEVKELSPQEKAERKANIDKMAEWMTQQMINKLFEDKEKRK